MAKTEPVAVARGSSSSSPAVRTDDWPAQAADSIVRVVGTVRDATTSKAITAARAIVFGLLAALLGLAVVVLLSIALVRYIDVRLPGSWFGDNHTWAAHLLLGLVFTLVGGVLWAKRRPARESDRRNTAETPVVPLGTTTLEDSSVPEAIRDVVIIGSGPAGLTAAVYTARANLAPLVLEGEPSSTSDQPGGQLMLTTEVENFPGFPEGIMGPELMIRFREQAGRFGADLRTERVTRVDLDSRPFGVWVGDPDTAEPTYQGRTIIVATGAQSLMLGLEDEGRLIGHGVSTCATCDGFFFREHGIAVVGGGDSALEEAIFLTKFASSVAVVHRRDQLRASKIMQDRAFANEKIRFVWDSVVEEIVGETKLEDVRVRNLKTDEVTDLNVTGLFVAIGHQPNTALFKGQLEMEDSGYIVTHDGTRTSVDGVFACGDVQDHDYRQAITAAGSGCMAAIDAERWLEAEHG